MADNKQSAKMWHDAASAGKDCLPLEVLEKMTENTASEPKAAAHLSGCANCQTELSMLKNFEKAAPAAEEGAAVAWIAAQLQRQQPGAAKPAAERAIPFWRSLFRLPYLAGATALAVVLALGISLYNSDGGHKIGSVNIGSAYRAEAVHVNGPSGNLAQAPAEFSWEAYQGAASYKIELMDVLGTSLASISATKNEIAVTPEMQANMRPGKPLKWKVTALDASGKAIADSSTVNFKIK